MTSTISNPLNLVRLKMQAMKDYQRSSVYCLVLFRTVFDRLDRQIKGVLPTDKDLASADALLKRAIDTDTFAPPI